VNQSGRFVTLGLVLTIDRGVYFGLTAVILLMSLFLIWFPVPTPRNMVVHSFVFATFFLSKAFVIVVRTIRGDELHHAFSIVLLALGIICLCIWTILLRREEEDPAVTFGRRWNPEEETRLIRQLRAINSSLGRLSRD
jgi:phosphatidylserine synthase